MPVATPETEEVQKKRVHATCRDCDAVLVVDGFDEAQNPTIRETVAFVNQVADAKGWGYGVENINGENKAYWICPTHLKRTEEAVNRVLPKYNSDSHCAACGHGIVGTIHCHGRTSACELGAPRNHLHRTCERCGWKWIEGRLDDPKAK